MCEQADYEDRKTLRRWLNSGKKPREAARELRSSPAWAYKWKKRFEEDGWAGLQARSRAPKHVPGRTSVEVHKEILRIRSELEAEVEDKDNLGYIGADAIYGRLRTRGLHLYQLLAQSSASCSRLARPSPVCLRQKKKWSIHTGNQQRHNI